MELELKHLSAYLPYGLKVQIGYFHYKGLVTEMVGLTEDHAELIITNPKTEYFDFIDFFPILRPLSDYTDITSKSMSDLDCDLTNQMDIQEFALKKMSLSSLLYSSFDVLTRNHVDIFGLIPEGLAIDINTINP